MYYIFPVIIFILTTIRQTFSHESIQWRENIGMLLFILVFIYLFQMLYNWSKTPYSWKKEDK